jgi:Caspase domain/Sulfatase-modifying factor enzyme 1
MFLMKKILQLLVLQLFITQSFAQTTVNAARKKALVIGNAAYPGEPLIYPTNDARAIAAFLKKNGFDVTLDSNLNWQAMMNALYDFRQKLSEGDISLFFFAGHGMERHKANYLYPIPPQAQASNYEKLVNLDIAYLSSLESKKCLLNIVLLNACRVENTVMSAQSIGVTDSNSQNSNTLLSFAAAPSRAAYDKLYGRTSDLSVYTESFLNIAREGCSLNDIFPRLVDSVLRKTSNTEPQHPWVHHSMNSEAAGFKFTVLNLPMMPIPIQNGQELSPFSIGRHEVTQAEWENIMSYNPASNPCNNCPIENVSLKEIQSFIETLNRRTNKKYRLCTETEWEYAAGGGQNYKYSGSNDLEKVGWYANNAQITQLVESKPKNIFGLYDMSGNVSEWCIDSAGVWVLRGGGLGTAKTCEITHHFPIQEVMPSRFYGFRLCISEIAK